MSNKIDSIGKEALFDPRVTGIIPKDEIMPEAQQSSKKWYDALEVIIDGRSKSLQEDEPTASPPPTNMEIIIDGGSESRQEVVSTPPMTSMNIAFDRNQAARFAELLAQRYPSLNGSDPGHKQFMHLAAIARHIYDLAATDLPDESHVPFGQMTAHLNGIPSPHDAVGAWLGIAPMDVSGNSILHGGSYLAAPAFNVMALAGRSVCGL